MNCCNNSCLSLQRKTVTFRKQQLLASQAASKTPESVPFPLLCLPALLGTGPGSLLLSKIPFQDQPKRKARPLHYSPGRQQGFPAAQPDEQTDLPTQTAPAEA